jgi:hypothetical protein
VGLAVLRCDRALKNFKLNYFSIKGRFFIIFCCIFLADIVLSWLTHSNGNLSHFEGLIAETADRAQGYQWGEIDTTKQFQPLIEPQPIVQSQVLGGKLRYKHRYLKNICLDRRPAAIKKMSSVKIKLT